MHSPFAHCFLGIFGYCYSKAFFFYGWDSYSWLCLTLLLEYALTTGSISQDEGPIVNAYSSRTMRGHLTDLPQPHGTGKTEKIASVMQLGEQEDAEDGEVTLDKEPGIDYKPEGPDLNDLQVIRKMGRKTPIRVCKDGAPMPRDLQTENNALLDTRSGPVCTYSMRT